MATRSKRWTLDEVHSLPDDGNKYELIHGELFVTPAPTPDHETILARLSQLLMPYVVQNDLGMIYHPRAVVRVRDSEVEPDLMVRRAPTRSVGKDWEMVAIPLLVVEVLSPYTRRRDHTQKREWYMDIGIGEYWIVDPEERTVRVVKRGREDLVVSDTLCWHPDGADAPLEIDIAAIFIV